VVILAPTDQILLKAQPVVVAQLLRDAGFKVDLQAMDWQTVVTRRAIQKPPKEGGWNMFFTYQGAADSLNPLVNVPMVGKGTSGGWYGWSEDPKLEELRDSFARATSPEERKKIALEVQKEAYDQVIYVPLGQFQAPSAWRKSLTGVIDGPATPMFWNVDKNE
jgi:peptide/nickel transport system substrate-binding protein